MVKIVEKVVKDAILANKYKCGTKEVLRSVKGSKLIIVSQSLDLDAKAKLEDQARSANVPIYQFVGNSLQLGKLCNKSFRITTIALKAGTDSEIQAIISENTPQKTSHG